MRSILLLLLLLLLLPRPARAEKACVDCWSADCDAALKVYLPTCAATKAKAKAKATKAPGDMGTYTSPLGRLKFTRTKDDAVTATIVDAQNTCAFKPGTVVLSGFLMGDSIAGTMTTCRVASETCGAGSLEGETVLLITKEGRVLSGAAHFKPGGGCTTPLGDALVLRKEGTEQPEKKKTAKELEQEKLQQEKRKEALALLNDVVPLLTSKRAPTSVTRAACEKAAALDPTLSQAYTCLGVTYFEEKRYEDAMEFYRRGLEQEPSNAEIYYHIGYMKAEQGQAKEALDYLKLALLNGYIDLHTIDKDYAPLRGNPALEKLKRGEDFE